jgi:hypothetical protein
MHYELIGDRIVARTLRAIGLATLPVSPDALAASLGMELVPLGALSYARCAARAIEHDTSASSGARSRVVARACVRWLVAQAGHDPQDTALVNYVVEKLCGVRAELASPGPGVPSAPTCVA